MANIHGLEVEELAGGVKISKISTSPAGRKMIHKVSTVTGIMLSTAVILLAALNLDAVAVPAPSSVTVNNTSANPVPTVDVGNPAK